MKRILYSAALMLALLATACGDANQKTSALPQIDVRTNYPEKEICLQDVAEVSYITLETTDKVLLDGGTGIEVLSSKGIVCVSDNKVYIFNSDGKLRSILDKRGEGPGEYRYLYFADVDWERKEIYVHDGSQKALLVYSLDGAYKHQFKVDVRLRQHDLLNDNRGHLILYQEKQGYQVEGRIEPPYRPVVRLSLEDGKVDSLSWQSHYYTTMQVMVKLGDNNSTIKVPMPALVRLNNEIYVSEVASDTIYRLVEDNLEPFIVRTPSVQNEDVKYLLHIQGVTHCHYFLRFQKKIMDATSTEGNTIHIKDDVAKKVLYNKETGDICIPKFSNKDYRTADAFDELLFNGSDANTAYMKLEAFDLVEALEAGELSGELKTIAEGLKEDDNPVLMVVKFKE